MSKTGGRVRVLFTAVAVMLSVMPMGAASAAETPTELFISEYIEGSSNHKAVEIYNGTGATVDLAAGGYNLQYFFNGATSAGLTLNLAGSVASGDVHVFAHSSSDSVILAQADQTNGSGWFNGDDAVVLRRGTTVIDSLGQVGVDPGSEWGSGLTSTADNTLRRLASVCTGDTNPADVFDPALEWTGYATNTFDGLGAHTATCEPSGPAEPQPLPLEQDFSSCALVGWEIVSVDTDTANTWSCSGSFGNIEANGFGNDAPADEWLITPALDLDAQDHDTLSFESVTGFSDSGLAYPQLSVLYSTDYDGGGDPSTASWSELSGFELSPAGSFSATDSGPVDLSAISGASVHIAFRYQSSGTGSGAATVWRLDDISVTSAPPPPVTPCDPAPAITPISTIQGPTDESPCVGDTVTIEAVVVGDYEGPSPNLRGFYVQQADGTHDADPATSEGIFVFHGNNDGVSVGDAVRITGEVSEFQDQTQIAFPETLEVLDSGVTVTPATASLPVPSADYFERYEGMLVTFEQSLYVTELFQLGRFGQVVVSSDDRLSQPTNVVSPGAEANALQAANNLNRLIVDDGLNDQNPDPIRFGRGGNPLTASNTLRGGDTLTGAVGVMTYTWSGDSFSGNAYRFRPQTSDGTFAFAPANIRPPEAPSVGGTLQVASFNVLNYFLTPDDGGLDCGPIGFPHECRGAETEEEFERQREKLLVALQEIDADVLGLVEMENTEGVEPMEDIVAGLNGAMGAGTYDYIATGTVGTDAIKVGVIYKPSAVTPIGTTAYLDSTVDPRFDDDLNRVPVAQTFVENATGEVFSVVVNHLKSKGCGDSVGLDTDQGDGQSCYNAARTAAAEALVDWMDSSPTGIDDPDFLVIGDLNSYAQEDPIAVLADAGYTDLLAAFEGADAYTYVFDGQWGYLDYAMSSPSLTAQVTGAAGYAINSDEPSALDYNTNFKTEGQVASLYAVDEYRTSDHDPVIVGLGLSTFTPDTVATPDRLWPPNHQYESVQITSTAGADDLVVWIWEATSSEADEGLGEDDLPNDIVVTGDDTLDLRAERYSDDGRTYTVTVLVTADDGQTKADSVVVVVPRDQGRRGGPPGR